jgi:hypothetical protein
MASPPARLVNARNLFWFRHTGVMSGKPAMEDHAFDPRVGRSVNSRSPRPDADPMRISDREGPVWQWRRSPFSISSIFAFSRRALYRCHHADEFSRSGRTDPASEAPNKVTSSITGFRMFAVPRATSGKNLPELAGVEGGPWKDTVWGRHQLDVMSAS